MLVQAISEMVIFLIISHLCVVRVRDNKIATGKDIIGLASAMPHIPNLSLMCAKNLELFEKCFRGKYFNQTDSKNDPKNVNRNIPATPPSILDRITSHLPFAIIMANIMYENLKADAKNISRSATIFSIIESMNFPLPHYTKYHH